jgi:hypothetical protein
MALTKYKRSAITIQAVQVTSNVDDVGVAIKFLGNAFIAMDWRVGDHVCIEFANGHDNVVRTANEGDYISKPVASTDDDYRILTATQLAENYTEVTGP